MSDANELTPEVIPGRKGRGKGKASRTAKENIIAVFERIGGYQYMARWAKQNPTEFFKLYAKLIPVQVDAEIAHRFVMAIPAAAESTDQWVKSNAPQMTVQ